MLMTMYYTMNHAFIPGKIETVYNIIDAKDLSLFQLPVSDMIFLSG